MKRFIFILAFTAIFKLLYSQVLLPVKEEGLRREIFIKIGMKPEFTTTLGFQSTINKNVNQWRLGATISMAPLILKQGAYKFSLFSNYNFSNNNAGLIVQPAIYFAHLRDIAGSKFSVGFEIDGSPYWQGKLWTKAIMINWQHSLLTYFRHSDATKASFDGRYPIVINQEPNNGWYRSTANRFRLGFMAARRITSQITLQFNVGSQAVLQRQKVYFGFAYGQIPVFAEGILRYRLSHP